MPASAAVKLEDASPPGQELAPSLARFVELLHSVPALETNYTNRNLLLDEPGEFGEAQYNGVAHLIAIVKRSVGKPAAVDHLIDNAKLFAGSRTELSARLEAWRESLKQKTVSAPRDPSYDGHDVEKTSDGRTYLLLKWRTFFNAGSSGEPSPLRGVLPPGWRAEITYRRWGKDKTTPFPSPAAPAGGPGETSRWQVPRPWLFTLRCDRRFFIEGQTQPEIEEVVYIVPPLQRWVAVALFVALAVFAIAFFLLLTKVNGLTEVPWGSTAAFLAIVVALPPLRFLQTWLQDTWISSRLGVTAIGAPVAAVLWLLVNGNLAGLQAGNDGFLCNGVPWEPHKWRVFSASQVGNDGRPASETCQLAMLKPFKDKCPSFSCKSGDALSFDTFSLRFFNLRTCKAETEVENVKVTCEKDAEIPKAPVRVLQSCSDGPVTIAKHPVTTTEGAPATLAAGEKGSVRIDEIVEAYEKKFNGQLNTMEFWTIGAPVSPPGEATTNIAVRMGGLLKGEYAKPPSDTLLLSEQYCNLPERIELRLGGRDLVATGSVSVEVGPNKKGRPLRLVELQLGGGRLLGKIKLQTGGVEQVANVSMSGSPALPTAWIVDVLPRKDTFPCTLDDEPAPIRVCMRCPVGVRRPGADSLCTLYQERTTAMVTETGDEKKKPSCGP